MPAWPTAQLLAWIERIESRARRGTLFELLEVTPAADNGAIAAAFHRVASGAHPDLHRRTLAASDAERLLGAYCKVAAAYDLLRDPKARIKYKKELDERGRPTTQAPVAVGAESVPVQRSVPAAAAFAGRVARPTAPEFAAVTAPGGARTTGASRAITAADGAAPRATTAADGGAPRATLAADGAARTTPTRSTGAVRAVPAAATVAPPASPASPASMRGSGGTVLGRGGATAARTGSEPPTAAAGAVPSASTRESSGPTRAAPATTTRPQGDSRPPGVGINARAQVYYRKAQSCLAQGDLGGALFNLRLAAAADPRSSVIRMALAEVEAEIGPRKR